MPTKSSFFGIEIPSTVTCPDCGAFLKLSENKFEGDCHRCGVIWIDPFPPVPERASAARARHARWLKEEEAMAADIEF